MNVDLDVARAALRARLAPFIGDAVVPRLEEALTHPSLANESRLPDNQRLEFLGDAVLGLCVSELLVQRHPDADEGYLSRMRSALINAEALARWARQVGVGPALAMGRGARSAGERDQTNVLADAVEAVLAAVYEARGLEGARALVAEIVGWLLGAGDLLQSLDPKGALQEHVQGRGESAPVYRVVATHGKAPDVLFEVEVRVGDRVIGRGEGRSKRLAERAAAERAIVTERAAADADGGQGGGT